MEVFQAGAPGAGKASSAKPRAGETSGFLQPSLPTLLTSALGQRGLKLTVSFIHSFIHSLHSSEKQRMRETSHPLTHSLNARGSHRTQPSSSAREAGVQPLGLPLLHARVCVGRKLERQRREPWAQAL